MFWLVPLAQAIAVFDTGSGCSSAGNAIFSSPTPDAVGVPLDISPAFVYPNSDCGAFDATLSLVETLNGNSVTAATQDVSPGLGALELEAPLTADTAYTFTSATSFDTVSVGFTTGTGTSTPANVVPTVKSLSVSWLSDPAELHLDATVEYSGAGGADLITQWTDGPRDSVGGSTITRTGAPGLDDQSTWVSSHELSEAPAEWCLRARTRELNGDWVEGEVVCADVESAAMCGCSSGAQSSAAGLVFLAPLLGLHARRRR